LQLSRQSLVLLSADKGKHRLPDLDHRPAPQLATHGSFSLTVNYHALGQYCARQGGLALLPHHQPANLELGCLLFLDDAPTYRETLAAYERYVGDYGPDDYFRLKKLIEQHYTTLDAQDITAVIRLSGYDAHIFAQMLPRLLELLPTLTESQRRNLSLAIPRIWETYYPLGEPESLAGDLGDLLLALDFYREAILYYKESIKLDGEDAHTLFKIAVCHCLLAEFAAASPIIIDLQEQDPKNKALQDLIQEFEADLELS